MEKTEIMKIGRIEFEIRIHGKRKYLLGFKIPSEKMSIGFSHAKIISTNNRAFLTATRWLWEKGYKKELLSLLRLCDYNINEKQLEEMYREEWKRVREEAEKFNRILRSWGVHDYGHYKQ